MNLIVFDIDDTLTKSEFQHQLAYVNTMKHFGITDINDNWSHYKHHTDSFILKENFETNFKKDFDISFVADFENFMLNEMLSLEKTTEIKGATHIIKSLNSNQNYAIAFATGSFLKPAILKLKHAKIDYNETLISASNQYYSRESIILSAIEKAKSFYNIKSFKSIISVGDGIWDMKAARNLNLHFIGIGMKNYSDFKSENIKVHIKNWTEFNLDNVEQKLGIK